MGIGGIGIWQLLIILLIVIMIFGTKRLKSLGGDLGGALKSFRKAMDTDDEKNADAKTTEEQRQIGNDDGDAQFEEQKEQERHS
jgi:sec-independent protein translocase protein TatA